MKIILLVVGSCIAFVSILGYFDAPSIISQMVHSIMGVNTGSTSSSSPITTSSMLHSMGYPSRSVVVPIMQDSFLGLAIVGIGMAGFGTIAKNRKRQFMTSPVSEEQDKKIQENSKTGEMPQTSLRILQERLAKGEITSSEFQRMKKLLDDRN
jgi:uncharacterized membrane protein